MKKTIAGVVILLALMSSAVMAAERAGDAALGALSGAVVLGPVGAVARRRRRLYNRPRYCGDLAAGRAVLTRDYWL